MVATSDFFQYVLQCIHRSRPETWSAYSAGFVGQIGDPWERSDPVETIEIDGTHFADFDFRGSQPTCTFKNGEIDMTLPFSLVVKLDPPTLWARWSAAGTLTFAFVLNQKKTAWAGAVSAVDLPVEPPALRQVVSWIASLSLSRSLATSLAIPLEVAIPSAPSLKIIVAAPEVSTAGLHLRASV